MPTLDPVTPGPHLYTFIGYGFALKYMIVDRDNQRVVPKISGDVIPEAVSSIDGCPCPYPPADVSGNCVA